MQARSVILLVHCLFFIPQSIKAQYYTPSGKPISKQVYDIYYGPKVSAPAIPVYSPGVNNSNTTAARTVDRSSESKPSAAAQKAFDDAQKKFDDNIARASKCVCNVAPYSEVKFTYTSPQTVQPSLFRSKSEELFDMAGTLNSTELMSGYLLAIRMGNEYVVAVENQQNVWNPYLVNWSAHNTGRQWDGYYLNIKVPATSQYAGVMDKLKYVEAAIIRERDRKNSEIQQMIEDRKLKEEEARLDKIRLMKDLKEKPPYDGFSFQNGWGTKLNIKGYKPGPNESFVTFVNVMTTGPNNLYYSNTPFSGKVYKVVFDRPDNYYIHEYLSYQNVAPDSLKGFLWRDPYAFKIIERVVNENLGVITREESARLKKEEQDFFNSEPMRLEMFKWGEHLKWEKQARKQHILDYTVFNTGNYGYIGDTYGGKAYGLGVYTSFGRYGSYIDDVASRYVDYEADGSIRIAYMNDPSCNNCGYVIIRKDGGISLSGDYSLIYLDSDFRYMNNRPISGNDMGKKYMANGDIYHGEFKDSQFSGGGALLKASGIYLRGSFINGLPQGNMIVKDKTGMGNPIVFENGLPTEKKWKLSVPENANGGYGEIKFASGDTYLGELSKGKPYANGLLIYANGDSLFGYFTLSDPFRGLLKTRDGRMIFGFFKPPANWLESTRLSLMTEKSYQYLVRYPNGDIFVGKINDSFSRVGAGMCYYKNGDIYMGNYENDKRSDPEGLMVYKKGPFSQLRDICRGPFVNDVLEGPGEFIHADGLEPVKFTGNFKNGVLDGEVNVLYLNKPSIKGTFRNGRRVD